METKIITKPNMQRILKELRTMPFCDVQKIENGYLVTAKRDGKTIKKGDTLLKAMIGTYGYRVRSQAGMLDTSGDARGYR
tara:strand:- start:137 stop:376 length:240 start_codon:yes stop_codon:yes gene_type:complete